MKMRKRNQSLLLTLVLVLAMFAFMPVAANAADSVTLYVYSAGGDDYNDGSLNNPYATIGKAISTAQAVYSGDEVTVYVMAGDYVATEYITHANLTIEAFNAGEGNYDYVTIYPDYNSTNPAPISIYTPEWIFAANNLSSKVGFTLSHINLSGDDPITPGLEDGTGVTGVYMSSADGAGTYMTLDNCTINDMQLGVRQNYSDYITVSILNSVINAQCPVSMEYGSSIVIENSALTMTTGSYSSAVVSLNNLGNANITNTIIRGNEGVGRGIYGNLSGGVIAGNEFLALDIALELNDIANLIVSDNYVETTNHGFDLETYYYNPASMTVSDNTMINKAKNNGYQTGIRLYLNDDTSGSSFNVYGNEIVNFAYGLYYDGDDYYSDIIGLNLSHEGTGNKFRGNILNMYIETLRSTSKVDMRNTDWGTTDRQEVYDRIYFRDVYPSSDGDTAAATHEDAFSFDDVLATSALETVYVDDDYTSSTTGFGETRFNSIVEAKPWVRSGGTIYVADGLYDEQVFIFQPVTIHGSGENTIIKNTTGDYNNPILLVSSPNTTIRGMNFQDAHYGLTIGDFDYCRTILNKPISFTYYDSMADNAIVYNNNFGNQGYASISVDYQNAPDTLDGLTIEGNTFHSDTRRTYHALLSRYDLVINSLVIKDNQILYGYSNGFGLRFGGNALMQGNDILIDGSFDDPFAQKIGFTLFAEGSGLISDNTFHIADGINYASSEQDSVGIRYEISQAPLEPITAQFYNNTFSGFDYALYFYAYDVNLNEGTINVTVGGSNEHYNDLNHNTYGVVSQYKPVSIDASYNLWGASDEDIPDMILDINDQSYYGVVTYLPSATLTVENPLLSDLQVNPVALSPSFEPGVYEYTASVDNEVTAIIITPSAIVGTIYLNDNEVTSDSQVDIPLVVGLNTVTIEVENGALSSWYTLSITRLSADNPVLSNLLINPGTLSPSFDSKVYEYTASVNNSVTTITITPSVSTGTIYIDENEIPSGSSTKIPLVVGQNNITIEVKNGELSSTYSLSIKRKNSSSTSGGGGWSPAPKPEPEEDVDEPALEIRMTIGEPQASVGGAPYTLDAPAFIKSDSNRTLVPIRFVAEALGGEVEWLAPTRQVIIRQTIDSHQMEIVLTLGLDIALINGEPVTLDGPAETRPPGRTFVPLRFVSETLGAQVDWDPDNQEITITR